MKFNLEGKEKNRFNLLQVTFSLTSGTCEHLDRAGEKTERQAGKKNVGITFFHSCSHSASDGEMGGNYAAAERLNLQLQLPTHRIWLRGTVRSGVSQKWFTPLILTATSTTEKSPAFIFWNELPWPTVSEVCKFGRTQNCEEIWLSITEHFRRNYFLQGCSEPV